MTQIVIQIQPDRDLSKTYKELFQGLLSANLSPRLSEYPDHINIILNVDGTSLAWTLIKKVVQKECPEWFENVAIVTCEGDHGWEDYLLLHHFDKAEKTDEI